MNNNNKCQDGCCSEAIEIDAVPAAIAAIKDNLAVMHSTFMVEGLDCMDCVNKLEKKIAGLPGVEAVTINFNTAKMTVAHETTEEVIIRAVEQAGYKVGNETSIEGVKAKNIGWWKQRKSQLTLLSGILLAVATGLEWAGGQSSVLIALYVTAALIGGYHTGKSGFYSLLALTFDMNFLMSIAVIGAMAIGEWGEAATVAFLFSFGNTLQAYTMDKTRNSIKSLMELAPSEALVLRCGEERRLPVVEILIGERIIVKPGEMIAMDGYVLAGVSTVNQAAITGESAAIDKTVGDRVYAGTLNEYGVLEIEVSKVAADSTLSKIMHLVEEAQAQKAPSQQIVDVFAKYYTPIVLLAAAGVMVIPWLFFGHQFAPWFYQGLVLLVISCPCALVISTPVSIVAAIGNASRNGVLIKGGIYLEQLRTMKAIAFDKTGTLTQGRPQVTDVISLQGYSETEILTRAASIEKWFEHPLALAIVEKAKGLELMPSIEGKALVGKGAQADIAGETHYIGTVRLFEELGGNAGQYAEVLAGLQQQGKTVMILGTKNTIYGLIAVADTVRESSLKAIQALRKTGIKHMVMLTGDNKQVAKNIASELQIDDYYSELLPEDKVAAVQNIASKYGKVMMVGDGVNDAPALSAASVGVAMGVAGSDTALETADIALMADELSKLAYVIHLSRKTVAIIKQNIGFAILIKVIFVALTFVGMANLWLAVFADMGSSILVTLNGMRLIRNLR